MDAQLHVAAETSTAVPLALVSFFSSAFFAAAICQAGILAFPPPEPNLLVGVPLLEAEADAATGASAGEKAGVDEASGCDCVVLLPSTCPFAFGAGADSVEVLDEVPFA